MLSVQIPSQLKHNMINNKVKKASALVPLFQAYYGAPNTVPTLWHGIAVVCGLKDQELHCMTAKLPALLLHMLQNR